MTPHVVTASLVSVPGQLDKQGCTCAVANNYLFPLLWLIQKLQLSGLLILGIILFLYHLADNSLFSA